MKTTSRRTFLATTAAASLAPLAQNRLEAAAAGGVSSQRDFYELRQDHFDTEEQRNGFDKFMREAAIPACERIGVKPVGVFYPRQGFSPAYTLLRFKSLDSFVNLIPALGADSEFMDKSSEFLDAPASKPAFKRYESSLLHAFTGMPELELPVKTPGRVFQLRIYESASVKAALKKIEMFNDAGELRIFREVGLMPVFFGQTLSGQRMPNLTYMLGFESEEQQQANWRKFTSHPDWKTLSAMPEYANSAIVSNITNILLKPAEYSKI